MIDYEKLREAHKLAEKLPYDWSINLSVRRLENYLFFHWMYGGEWHSEKFLFNEIDNLIWKLKEMTRTKAKYDVGQIVYLMGDDKHPVHSIIIDKIIYEDGDYWYLIYTSECNLDQYREDCLYPTRQAFIESQIKFWCDLSEKPATEILCDTVVEKAQERFDEIVSADDGADTDGATKKCYSDFDGIRITVTGGGGGSLKDYTCSDSIRKHHDLECEHVSDGIEYMQRESIQHAFYDCFKCKYCGEFYK